MAEDGSKEESRDAEHMAEQHTPAMQDLGIEAEQASVNCADSVGGDFEPKVGDDAGKSASVAPEGFSGMEIDRNEASVGTGGGSLAVVPRESEIIQDVPLVTTAHAHPTGTTVELVAKVDDDSSMDASGSEAVGVEQNEKGATMESDCPSVEVVAKIENRVEPFGAAATEDAFLDLQTGKELDSPSAMLQCPALEQPDVNFGSLEQVDYVEDSNLLLPVAGDVKYEVVLLKDAAQPNGNTDSTKGGLLNASTPSHDAAIPSHEQDEERNMSLLIEQSANQTQVHDMGGKGEDAAIEGQHDEVMDSLDPSASEKIDGGYDEVMDSLDPSASEKIDGGFVPASKTGGVLDASSKLPEGTKEASQLMDVGAGQDNEFQVDSKEEPLTTKAIIECGHPSGKHEGCLQPTDSKIIAKMISEPDIVASRESPQELTKEDEVQTDAGEIMEARGAEKEHLVKPDLKAEHSIVRQAQDFADKAEEMDTVDLVVEAYTVQAVDVLEATAVTDKSANTLLCDITEASRAGPGDQVEFKTEDNPLEQAKEGSDALLLPEAELENDGPLSVDNVDEQTTVLLDDSMVVKVAEVAGETKDLDKECDLKDMDMSAPCDRVSKPLDSAENARSSKQVEEANDLKQIDNEKVKSPKPVVTKRNKRKHRKHRAQAEAGVTDWKVKVGDDSNAKVVPSPETDKSDVMDVGPAQHENDASDKRLSVQDKLEVEGLLAVPEGDRQAEPSTPTVEPKHESFLPKKQRKHRGKNSDQAQVESQSGLGGKNGKKEVVVSDGPEPMDVSSPVESKEVKDGTGSTQESVGADEVGALAGDAKAPRPAVESKRRGGHKKRKRHRRKDDSDDGEKATKKGRILPASTHSITTTSRHTPEPALNSTRKITLKTRLKTPPKTPPRMAHKTPPKMPATRRTPRGSRRKRSKDDDGFAYFCALCHEFGELLCCEKCKQTFHLACLGLKELPEADPWMCDNCVENKVECFDCKEFTSLENHVLTCSFKNCSKFFHEDCARNWVRAQAAKTSATKKSIGFICPHHTCDACGNPKTPKKSKLYRCLYCPVAYHESCAPDGTQFLEDVPGFMSCWKHDDDWKREIQNGEQIRDVKTLFQLLPLPGVNNEFQVPQFIHEEVKKLNRKPSPITHIRRNIYVAKKPKKRSEDGSMQCLCKSSEAACEKDCLCGSCGCGDTCRNVPFQKRPCRKLKPVKTENCGWGLKSEEDIKAGDFLVEYVGEVIDDKTCEERLWAMKRRGETNFYMCEISREMVIDATFKGNLSRYINHSCRPNSELQKWEMDGEIRIGVFAMTDIRKGDYITYDYQFIQFGMDQQCHCGSSACRGQLGVKSQRPKDVNISALMSRPFRSTRLSENFNFQHQHCNTIDGVFRHRKKPIAETAKVGGLEYADYEHALSAKWVGARVAIWWPLDQKYYSGEIVSYNPSSKKHQIRYNDGDIEDLNMSKEAWLVEKRVPTSNMMS